MKKVNLEEIKRLRKEHKLSQGDMAELIGLNTLYPYHRKESGNQSFTAEEIHTIADFFNQPVEYFFEDLVANNATKQIV
ncbi:Cro/Cl family transcriptional regulator [Oceanobacillus picturae]|uniref:Cro/Cl family transcriptional regulator n=1 Tax=Oceanobacillus picturae TaxID=171693 RepID=A0A0U9H7M7_9BACI|nr:helix-turn-helix transcriptional regulator [Oceanobacillus picturae]GAQ17984.1 Cro/Cl family transcriptional regulator [Oceanobacillus picturae]